MEYSIETWILFRGAEYGRIVRGVIPPASTLWVGITASALQRSWSRGGKLIEMSTQKHVHYHYNALGIGWNTTGMGDLLVI